MCVYVSESESERYLPSAHHIKYILWFHYCFLRYSQHFLLHFNLLQHCLVCWMIVRCFQSVCLIPIFYQYCVAIQTSPRCTPIYSITSFIDMINMSFVYRYSSTITFTHNFLHNRTCILRTCTVHILWDKLRRETILILIESTNILYR